MSLKSSLLSLLLLTSIFSFGQILKPVKWDISKEKKSETEYVLIFKANINKDWTVYSQYTSDEGPVPTSITYEKMDGVEFKGKADESGHKKEGPDPLFDNVKVIKYLADKSFIIKQKIKIKDASKPLSGYLTYMTCNNERCLPPEDVEFEFTFSDLKTGSKDVKAVVEKPVEEKPVVVSTDIPTVVSVDTNIADTTKAVVNTLPTKAKIENGVIDNLIPNLLSTYKKPLAKCAEQTVESSGYFTTFIFGFLGGLFALLTPCVFPMIPITVSFFTKDTKRKGWVNGLIYGLSIIGIYIALGLLITAIFGPEALNRLSTNWIANTLFFIIFIVFAFSFFGFYEITLPSSWSTKSDRMADKGGLIGIFFMAFTLALVSFSCTGPIIGTALVQAASKGEYLGPFLVMFGFSLALALPFGLFAAFPAWLNSLPKSGSWMNSVKVVLGFLELALALKFLSVADLTNHWGFLKYELFMGLWIIVFLAMALYLFGFIKFPHDSPLKKLSMTRKAFGTLVVFLCVYLAYGFKVNKETNTYNALTLMSGLAPSANYNFFLKEQDVDATIKAKYPSYGKGPQNINAFKDYYEALSYAKEIGKPLFIDFTGHGCVNCRKTEEHIWVDDKIRNRLNNDVVLVSLYVDDDKKLTEVLKSKSRGNKIRNIGNLWADFQIINFEQNSQPLYIMVDPNTENVITSPRPFKEGVEDYDQYMTCGLTYYNSNK